MNIFKVQWLDYIVTYIVTTTLFYLTFYVNPLFCFPAGWFAYYLQRGTVNWLYKTDQINNIVEKMSEPFMKSSGKNTVTGIELMSVYATLSTLIISPAFFIIINLNILSGK
jgi:hypothetical protein